MKYSQLIPSIREEVDKQFSSKLDETCRLIRMFAHRNACVSCSFGKDSTVVLWLALQENPQIPVVFTNTGVEFTETLQFRDELKEKWNLNLIEGKPKQSFWKLWQGRQLPDGSKHKKRVSLDRCCRVLKETPFKAIVKEYGFAYNFTGITVMEGRQRMLRICEKGTYYYHKTFGLWNVHPIAFWTPEEVWAFTKHHELPINEAYEKYDIKRVGCLPCTAYKGWREQLVKINPKMYEFIQEQFFHQKLLAVNRS